MKPVPEAAELFAENAALKELLEVYESSSVEQAQKLGRAVDALAETNQRLLDAERERARLAEEQAKRLGRELDIAAQIQTSILPRMVRVEGCDVAAKMVPADLVGGDYFDIIPTDHGCWFAIGDVAGHGLTAGLIMLMTQCAVMSLVRKDPTISPSEAIYVVNDVLYENIQRRMQHQSHMTLTLLHLERGGRLTFAGAHEDLLLLRAGEARPERVQTPGAWVGVMPDVRHATENTTLQIGVGDTLVLYTDGIIEAQSANTKQRFRFDQLAELVTQHRNRSSKELVDHLLAAVHEWAPIAEDDRTVLVLRRAV